MMAVRKFRGKPHSSCYPCMKGVESSQTFCVQDVVLFDTFRWLN